MVTCHRFLKTIAPYSILTLLGLGAAHWSRASSCVGDNLQIRLKAAESEAPKSVQSEISSEKLASEIAARRNRVLEFRFIAEEAKSRGFRVWLFGGTAAGYSYHVKWDVLRELGDRRYQPNRFDYDYTNIYRSTGEFATQDLDIVIDGTDEEAQAFEQALGAKFPYLSGSKSKGWEVLSIKEARGDKGGHLGDFGFMNQHTDSNSTGMVELTDPPKGQSVVRDIRDFENNQNPKFLKDVTEGKITYYHSNRHPETQRFRDGKNPPIFSVIRALTKAFEFGAKISDSDFEIFRKEINQFDRRRDLTTRYAEGWIEDNGKKLFAHAVDIEYAWDTLEKLGLRKKLISIQNNPDIKDSLAWWMNKEPLRTKPVGEEAGATAESLGIKTVAHETSDFLAYESIVRSHKGEPNVFESRAHTAGETADFGKGFYTAVGKRGAKGTGITIRFTVNPKAREGTDFVVARNQDGKVTEGTVVIWKNKAALTVIPESLDISPAGYLKFLAGGETIGRDDRVLLWKMKRHTDRLLASGEISEQQMEEIHSIALKQIMNDAPGRGEVIQAWMNIEGARLKKDPAEVKRFVDFLKTNKYRVDPTPLFAQLTEFFRGTDFEPHLTKEWLPAVLKSLKPDIGDRALEHCLFSRDPNIREFGSKALALREVNKPEEVEHADAFVRALKSIQTHGGDAGRWLESETKTEEQVQEKAAYLALHPELRQVLSEAESKKIMPAFDKISFLPVFEKLAGGSLPAEAKSESFIFRTFRFPPGGKRVRLGSPSKEPGRWQGDEKYWQAFGEDLRFTLLKDSFATQVTPITQLQLSIVMGENPSFFKKAGKIIKVNGKDILMNANLPAEDVTLAIQLEFIRRLNAADPNFYYQLPSDDNREFAARGGTDTAYFFGNDPAELGDYGWSMVDQTKEVASLKPNQYGLHDMSGNIWESTRDQSVNGAYRIRGGSWRDEPELARSSQRHHTGPETARYSYGFRVERVPK